jgi:MFS transporter, MHS family, shikimate and dehydroshikimate transport protein
MSNSSEETRVPGAGAGAETGADTAVRETGGGAGSASPGVVVKAVPKKEIRAASVASALGTIVEWYDFGLYGAAAALVIGPLFFPTVSSAAGVLASFATFAVGYFARPIGGIVIGHIGDRYGRRTGLVLSILFMGISTVLIGVLPTFAAVGVWAPIALVVLRLCQGFGAGAEFAGSVTLLSEYTPRNRHGIYTSIPYAAAAAGVVISTLTFFLASQVSGDALLSWGWRLPFLSSIVIFAIALFIRFRLEETPSYQKAVAPVKGTKIPLGELFSSGKNVKTVVLGFFSMTGFNVNSYIVNTFAISFLTVTIKMTPANALVAVVLAALAAVIACPLFGMLADRVGYRLVFMLGAAFIFVIAIPYFAILSTGNFGLVIVALVVAYGVGYGAMSGSQGAFLIRLFPTRYRFTGVAVTRELNGALIAGPTPLLAGVLVAAAAGAPWLVAGLLMLAEAITIVVLLLARKSDGNVEDFPPAVPSRRERRLLEASASTR